MHLLHSGSRRGEAGVLPGDDQSADGRAPRLSCDQVRRTCAWRAHQPGAEAGVGRRGLRIFDPRAGCRWSPWEGRNWCWRCAREGGLRAPKLGRRR